MSTTTQPASVNGTPTPFTPATRPGFVDTPVVATVAVAIPLDRSDLVAVLFFCHQDPGFEVDTADDEYLRLLIVDTVVNVGLTTIDSTLGEIQDMAADDPRREALEFCRRRVTELFPDVPRRTRRTNSRRPNAPTTPTGRELVNA